MLTAFASRVRATPGYSLPRAALLATSTPSGAVPPQLDARVTSQPTQFSGYRLYSLPSQSGLITQFCAQQRTFSSRKTGPGGTPYDNYRHDFDTLTQDDQSSRTIDRFQAAMPPATRLSQSGHLGHTFEKGVTSTSDDSASHSSESEEAAETDHRHAMRHCNTKLTAEEIFAKDSTTGLIRKFFVYKLMGSNLFVNHALTCMKLCYQILGIPPTNLAINTSVGDLFTSGETLQTLKKDMQDHKDNNIQSMACYQFEGLEMYDEQSTQEFYARQLETIKAQADSGAQGHIALKLTGFLAIDNLTRISTAQDVFVEKILSLNHVIMSDQEAFLDKVGLDENLREHGVNLTPKQLDALFQGLKIDPNADKLSRTDLYANGHLFRISDPNVRFGRWLGSIVQRDDHLNAALRNIALALNVTEEDLQIFENFSAQIRSLSKVASESNCVLHVDSEQTYLQGAIHSFAQQLIQDYNRGDQIIITNTFQCYLKRMKTLVPDEIAASKALGYNLGVKLVRGAYMNEERTVAAERGVDSPIWENIEQTHECYDTNLAALVQNVGEHGLVMLASHNVGSVSLAKEQMASHGVDADRVQFGQLKGFSDQVTNELALQDYKVCKYMPYGPTEIVMPYLLRRGQESRQVLREQEFQNTVLKQEIFRRLFGRWVSLA